MNNPNSAQWTEKYRPESYEEIRGQEQVIYKLRNFITDFNNSKGKFSKKKAVILHGPPGVGKTTLAHVTAREINAEIFELNASDLRNKDKLNDILKPATEQQTLMKKSGKIILVDEVDGISGTDRGGLTELLKIIEYSNYPMIITANNVWDKKLSTLRQQCEIIPLKEIDYKLIKNVMIDVLRKESKFVENDLLTSLAVKAKGDLRSALNDLQTAAGNKNLKAEDFAERNKEVDIFQALRSVFKSMPNNELLGVYDSVNLSIDDIILWVEENIPTEYGGKELAKAYELLGEIDVFRGRIYKQQYWRFLVYENIFLSYGIASAKKEPKKGFTTYKKPSRILKIWMNNQRTALKKSIAKKYAEKVHVGQKRALQEFPVLKNIVKSESIQIELKLTKDEIDYVNKVTV